MMNGLLILTIVGMLYWWIRIWYRFRDPFHPMIVFLPIFTFLYGFMPLKVSLEDPLRFIDYTGGVNAAHHLVVIIMIVSLGVGVQWGSHRVAPQTAAWTPIEVANPGLVRTAGIVFGIAAFAAWIYIFSSAGSFEQAYGEAYGGGLLNNGYIDEAPYIGLVGALFIYLTRTGRGMRTLDWALVIFCVSPVLIHAFLGARRGPTFLSLICLIGGYVYFMRKKVPLIALSIGAVSIGLFMLFLVANRDVIHLGSGFYSGNINYADLKSPFAILEVWNSNEYLISNAVVRYTQQVGGFYGLREFMWLIARILPTWVWPTVYQDLPVMFGSNINLLVNGGVDPAEIEYAVGWNPSFGSAEGYVASLWLEFQYLAPAVSMLIGWMYGRLWANARDNLTARMMYLLMIALCVYLVMQGLDPWLFRLLLLGIPTGLAMQLVNGLAVPQLSYKPAEAW